MKENEKCESTSTSIEFEVKVQKTTKDGQVIDAIVAGSKLTKADSGRAGYNTEDWLTVTIEPSKIDAQLPNISMNSHSKLTKADSGRQD
jgi:hypothetical protein